MSESEDFSERPIAWRVSAVDGLKGFVDGFKKQPHSEEFPTKALADKRKKDLQAAGMIATATPVFLAKTAREAGLKRRQGRTAGDFCSTWKLTK